MSKNLLTYIFTLMVLLSIFSIFSISVYAQEDGKTTIESKTFIQLVREGLNRSYGEDWFINLMVFILIFLILYAFLDEVSFIEKNRWMHWAFAFLLAAIATSFQPVMSGVVGLITFYGTVVTVGVFFAVLFIMALSHFYRKKAAQYEFFMGSEFATILIVHMPLILMLSLIGAIIGGIGEKGTFSAIVTKGPSIGSYVVPVALIIAVIAFILILILTDWRKESVWKVLRWSILVLLLIGILIALIFLGVMPANKLPILTKTTSSQSATKFASQFWGAVFGALIGLGYALLEKGRVKAIGSILTAEARTLKEMEKLLGPLQEDEKTLADILGNENWWHKNKGTTIHYISLKSAKEPIPAGQTREEIEARLQEIRNRINEIKMRMEIEKERAGEKFREDIWKRREI